MRIESFDSANGKTYALVDGLGVLGFFKTQAEAEQRRREIERIKLGEAHHRHAAQKCLNCGDKIDAATQLMDAAEDGEALRIVPESFGVCLKCGHIMMYGADLKLRELTDAEMVEVAGDERIVAFNNKRGTVVDE